MTAKKTAAAEPSVEDRVATLEGAVRVIARTLYGPNGGGDDNVAEAEALFAALCGDDEPPADPVEAAADPAPDAEVAA